MKHIYLLKMIFHSTINHKSASVFKANNHWLELTEKGDTDAFKKTADEKTNGDHSMHWVPVLTNTK